MFQRAYRFYQTLFQQVGRDHALDRSSALPPRKFIVTGMPGVGKSHYIKRMVDTLGFSSVVTMDGSEVFQFTNVGEGEKYLLDVFRSCGQLQQPDRSGTFNLMVVENIDAIFGTPYKSLESNGKIETSATLRRYVALFKQLLTKLPANTFFICTTTLPVEKMEQAIFGYRLIEAVVRISLPLEKERFDILRTICVDNAKKGAPACMLEVIRRVSEETHGYTPADLIQLYRDVVLDAAKRSTLLEGKAVLPPLTYETFRQHMRVTSATFTRSAFGNARSAGSLGENQIKLDGLAGFPETILQKIRAFVVVPMLRPERYLARGINPPRGALIHGKAGNGKTYLCQAIGNEISDACNVVHVNCTSLLSKVVGETEFKINQLFQQARTVSSCHTHMFLGRRYT